MFRSLISNSFGLKRFGATLLLTLSLSSLVGHAQTTPAAKVVVSHYYLNGKLSSKEEVDKLNPKTIDRMDVLQGKQAVDYTHDPQTTGVIMVQTK